MITLSKALRAAPAVTAMGAMLLFAVPQISAQDDDHRDCRDRVEHAQNKLDREVSEHGQDSVQARYARHELHEAREHCSADYDNRTSDNDRYRDNDRQYSNTDNGQYQPNDRNNNDNGQYRDNRDYNNNNPNDNPNNNPNTQPYPDQQPH